MCFFQPYVSYESLLNRARLPSLEVGRLMNIAIQTFKILNELALTYLLELIEKCCGTRNLRNSENIFKIPLMSHIFFFHCHCTFSYIIQNLLLCVKIFYVTFNHNYNLCSHIHVHYKYVSI